MQTEMTITRTGNGNLAPLWPDQMEEGPVTVRPAVDAYAEGWAMPWATGGAAFALAMVYECPFAYAAYYGDVGENETSDVVALADVLALLG